MGLALLIEKLNERCHCERKHTKPTRVRGLKGKLVACQKCAICHAGRPLYRWWKDTA